MSETELVGLGHVAGPYGPFGVSKKRTWQYRCKQADVAEVLARLDPYLGSIKREQGRKVLAAGTAATLSMSTTERR